MMPYYYYNDHMVGGFGFLAALTWMIIVADLILVGVWLWKQIGKK